MSSDNPLATWQANFKSDIQMLSQLMLLRTRRSDEELRKEMRPLFQSAADSLSQLEAAETLLKKSVSAQSAQLSRLQEFHHRLALQTRRVAEIRTRIPTELSDSLALTGGPTPPLSRVASADTADDEGKENQTNNVVEERHHEHAVKTKKVPKKKTNGNLPPKSKTRPITRPKVQKLSRAPACEDDIPVIRSVEQAELDAAPQYVRGRLTVDKITVVVTKLNEIARKKYTLLAVPFRELNSADMNARQELEEAKCPETEGHQFLTDSDIRKFGGYRMDATVKASINMLRHVGSLKEVHGKKRTRILIIQ